MECLGDGIAGSASSSESQLGTEDYDGIAEILMSLALDKGGQSVRGDSFS